MPIRIIMKGKPVVTPTRLLECTKQIYKIPDSFIIASPHAVLQVMRYYNIRRIGRITSGCVFSLYNNGNEVGIVSHQPCGAPAMAIIIEELISLGAKHFIFVGSAGALKQGLHAGSAILSTKSIRGEGTSSYYSKLAEYSSPSPELNKLLENSLTKNGISYSKGVTWTTDALYMETKEDVKRFSKKGVLCVDMETSALFVVAEHHKADAAALLYVTDSLATLKWQPFFNSTDIEKGRLSLLKAAIDALRMKKNPAFEIKPLTRNIKGVAFANMIKLAEKAKRAIL